MRLREVVALWDWVALAAAFLLVCLGLAMMLSSNYLLEPISSLFVRQGIALVVGLSLYLFFARLPYHVLQRSVPVLYVLLLIVLIGVQLSGIAIRGTVSRLAFFGFQLQPSEFMKVVVVFAIAWIFARSQRLTVASFFQSLAVAALPALVVMLEPDFGMAALMAAVWGGLIIFMGLPWRAVAALALVGGLIFAGAWHWVLLDYQKARLQTFLHPAHDPLGSGYNVHQSIVALGSGEVIGRGLGHGPQSQLKFLPERHTDFILASLGEELGFVGISLFFGLYAVLLWRLLSTIRLTRDVFGQVVVAGAFFLLLISFTVSAGMNMGILPVTGIPLPLLSYGGSSLISTFILLGVCQSVRVYSKWVQAPPAELSSLN
jgi:rod shape determining protein RodA